MRIEERKGFTAEIAGKKGVRGQVMDEHIQLRIGDCGLRIEKHSPQGTQRAQRKAATGERGWKMLGFSCQKI